MSNLHQVQATGWNVVCFCNVLPYTTIVSLLPIRELRTDQYSHAKDLNPLSAATLSSSRWTGEWWQVRYSAI